jgi:hypothetical protein
MFDSVSSFLSSLGTTVFRISAILFVVLNGAAVAAFLITRNRRLVDRWTPKLVTADVVLLTAGLGVPLVSGLARMGINALASMLGTGPTPE